MSNGDPSTGAGEGLGTRARRHRSVAAGRLKVDAPLLAVILLCGLAVGAFIFREIRKNPWGMQTERQRLLISANYVEGLGFGSHLRCQGFVVGRVREVQPLETKDGLGFRIEARIDQKFSRWRFGKVATVQSTVGPTYLGLNAIELTYEGTMPQARVQEVTLSHKDAPDLASMQADAPEIISDVREIVEMLNKPLSELAKVDRETATAMERIVLNVHDASERMERASAALTEGDAGMPSTIERIQATAKDLQDAGRDLKTASAKSVQLEEQLAEQIDSLSREMHLRIGNIEYSALQILGDNPAERRALGRDIRSTAANLSSATAQIDDLIPRIGDTFLGRLLIRRDKKPSARALRQPKPRVILVKEPKPIAQKPSAPKRSGRDGKRIVEPRHEKAGRIHQL